MVFDNSDTASFSKRLYLVLNYINGISGSWITFDSEINVKNFYNFINLLKNANPEPGKVRIDTSYRKNKIDDKNTIFEIKLSHVDQSSFLDAPSFNHVEALGNYVKYYRENSDCDISVPASDSASVPVSFIPVYLFI